MRQLLTAILLGLALCAGLSHASDDADHDKKIRNFVGKMSLDELLGQTLMVGYRADSRLKAKGVRDSNNGLLDLVEQYKLGAVILFKHNFDEGGDDQDAWEHIHSLTSDLQKEAYKASSKGHRAPLLIAIDQEGGARVRLEKSVTRVPDPMHIGATRSEQWARQAGLVIGSEMRMLGINTVLAPVADINNNDLKDVIGKRAFGAHKDVVAPLAVQFMLGLKTARVLSFAKHFPGHGDAEEDPHLHLPKVNYADASRLHDWDIKPFAELIRNGVNGMVTAHLLAPLDPTNPVTISYKTIQTELRERLAFQGIILTDDLADMAGILKDADNRIIRERKEAAIAALEAGHDMLMFAFVRAEDDESHPERTLAADEFDSIYQALLSHYSEPGKREELEEKGYYYIPTELDWEKYPAGLRRFYEDPVKHPLETPSGKLEFYSQRLADSFPDDEERPPLPKWIEKGPSHDERLSSERAKKYPLLLLSNHGRWRTHAENDDISWTREIPTCKVRGADGYLYEPVWINPKDAAKRGIQSGDIVKVLNERGAVLGGAIVWERIMPGVVSQDHGARADMICTEPGKYLDRGGANNLISPENGTSQNCWGMATSGFLVEVEKMTLAQMEKWREQYPQSFKREYDPASGLRFNGWVEGEK